MVLVLAWPPVPAAKGMFSLLNNATKGDPKKVGFGKHSETQAALISVRHLILTLASCPLMPQNLPSTIPNLPAPAMRPLQELKESRPATMRDQQSR